MDLVTKDLLINFLIILLPLFLMQLLYQLKYAYRFEELKEWMFATFPILALILCMLFPVEVRDSFSLDLRRIPFILGALYGGYRLGFLLLFLIISVRYFLDSAGFYSTLLTFSFTAVFVFFLSKYYLKMSVKQRVITSGLVTFLSLMISFFFMEKVVKLNMETSIWIQYIVINVSGMVIVTFLWEVIRTNFDVLQKVMKAEKLELVSHLSASISHEVRNPLTASRGFMQLSSEKGISLEKRSYYADFAIEELDRATAIINDYLTFAKPAIEEKEKIIISEEIKRVIDVLTPLANMNGVQLNLSFVKNEHTFILGERKKLEQCLINIMKNGIESMPNGGKLQIDLQQDPSTLQITIQDEGTGMTEKQLSRLGEPYFTTKAKGTGLGMMVSFSIIKGMNGKVKVTSENGKGTCFTIKLPVYADKIRELV